jgi:hypothetical protein
VKYATEMGSAGVIYIPSFMAICSGIQVVLRLLPRKFERLQCWYCCWEEFTKWADEMRWHDI